tara:strand:+ start:2494 stop:5409 length:2916 start_codon:yes stop_codon:yes gene_type:complete
MAKKRIKQYVFTPGSAGSGTIIFPGNYDIDDLLVITNTTDNVIIYNFADGAYAGSTTAFTVGEYGTELPSISYKEDGYTTVTLAANTSTMSSTDKLLIYVEGKEHQALAIKPWGFGTDAIDRIRVSNPMSLIDADFEYGLQPTKWAGYGTVRGYPSSYELPGIDLEVSTITTDYTTTSSTNSLITIVFTATHSMSAGGVVGVSGLDSGVTGFGRADGNFIIFDVVNTTTIRYFARGIVGPSDGTSLYTDETLAKRGAFYDSASIPVNSITSDGAAQSTITLNFLGPHGLIPGSIITVNVASGTNAARATGPFVVLTTSALNSLTYLARSGGAVTSPSGVTLYAQSNATILHRPMDGGVILETKTPTYGAAVVRQTKKYFRYQSGKGYLWSSGTLFKPNYAIISVSANGTSIGAEITITTDAIDHGLQAGAYITLTGVSTSGYNGQYVVDSIVDDYAFKVIATESLANATPSLERVVKVYVTNWQGAAVRAGVFDDQNGIFWEFNGIDLYCVRRSSTFQIAGTCNVNPNDNLVSGNSTRFTEQLRVGDRVIIRGMIHFITQVYDNTNVYISPDYRGIAATGVKMTLVEELRVKQDQFNMDIIDGTGESGYNINLNKMQMVGIQYSWYGAGYVDFMCRGSDGHWIQVHRFKNNNINDEAYMRSGNLPIRYSIENDSPSTYLSGAMDASQTTVPAADLTLFPTSGILLIDNEMIQFTGKSTSAGAGNFTGCTRSSPLIQYQQGNTNTLTAGSAATHDTNTGAIIISNTCSPTLTHWGSALIADGGFDTDRGYMFNYQRVQQSINTTTKTVFLIRLAPSVANSAVGRLGAKDLLNRSQLLLQTLAITTANGSSSGAVVCEGILNPKNFANATWFSLNTESKGGQPSFAQIAESVTWTSGTYAQPGEQVFASTFPAADTGSTTDKLDLMNLKEMTGAPLGGDYKYPDGPDILAINIRTTSGTAYSSTILRWSEAQA